MQSDEIHQSDLEQNLNSMVFKFDKNINLLQGLLKNSQHTSKEE